MPPPPPLPSLVHLANYCYFVAHRCNFARRVRASEQANERTNSYATQRECGRMYARMRSEKSAILHAFTSLSLSLSLVMRIVVVVVVVRCGVRVTRAAVCVRVRDRYAIARAPTESMKIKRDCSSPSEVKDALECRDETRRDETRHDARRCNATQCDTTRRETRGDRLLSLLAKLHLG